MTDRVIVPRPTEIVDLYPAIVSINSLISPLMNSIFAQSRKPVFDFPLNDVALPKKDFLEAQNGPPKETGSPYARDGSSQGNASSEGNTNVINQLNKTRVLLSMIAVVKCVFEDRLVM